jgi:hypothetical protein
VKWLVVINHSTAFSRRLRALLTSQQWTLVDARYRTVFGLSRLLPKRSGSAARSAGHRNGFVERF